MTPEFQEFPKIPRLKRECVITEKIDGTNAQVFITDDGLILFGSRTRWITPDNDNFGFAKWATDHEEELRLLGPGRHYGEWWGQGIQRKYGLQEKRFSLFNAARWTPENTPPCCDVVPILYRGDFVEDAVTAAMEELRREGSKAAPGFMDPEGIVVYHVAGRQYFKRTLKKDEEPKSMNHGHD